MAKGRKTGGRDFEPGQSGNPAGREKFPDDVKRAKKLNAVEVARIIDTLFYLPTDEIKQVHDNPESTALEKMLAKIIMKAADGGDHFRLNFLFDRCVGKVTEKINVKMPRPTIINLIGDEAKAMVVGASQEDGDDE